MNETKTPEEWLEQYYAEIEPLRREKCLERLSASGYETESCEKLWQLWRLRYKKIKQGMADTFLSAWLGLCYASNDTGSILRTNGKRGIVQKALAKLCLSGEGRVPEQMLFLEMKNLVLCYTKISIENYRQSILGFAIRTNPDKAKRDVKENVLRAASELPQRYGLEKEFSLLTRAAEETLSEYLGSDQPEIL